ncbi:DNA primase subunit [Saccharomycopsis crataegensis]|uniref:DNA primase large subunit n=1 Tax=Saccharomycopsis crataegensis TaxID=43959 RepID=A0AAV5QS39_9ASCO|nr:DNA primase subunit [Saccharomycopsis crataegensis]
MFNKTKRIRTTTGRKNFEANPLKSFYLEKESLSSLYNTRLSFYESPPISEITLEDFEQWAIDRSKVLIEIESCLARNKTMKEMIGELKPLLAKHLPLSAFNGKNEDQVVSERIKDHYSHFILRLAFSRSQELRDRFVKAEIALFKIRYISLLTNSEQAEFLKTLNIDFDPVNDREKQEFSDQLYDSNYANILFHLKSNIDSNSGIQVNNQLIKQQFAKEHFIKVEFDSVMESVSNRSVFLRNGYAYIMASQSMGLLVNEFSKKLSSALVRTAYIYPRLDEDDRLLPILNHLSSNYTSIEYQPEYASRGGESGDINAESITTEPIMKHFPLEMKYLMKAVMRENHLKYLGRTQLTLFLKGIGLSVDESVKFFCKWFTMNGKLTQEKFYKEYKYNIRHCYGLEGSRINYKPWDYATILAKPKPGRNEYHGSIFRDLKPEALVNELKEAGITDQYDLTVILDDCAKGNYIIAITRVFEILHKDELDNSKFKFEGSNIVHPNLWFDRSRQLERQSSEQKVESDSKK